MMTYLGRFPPLCAACFYGLRKRALHLVISLYAAVRDEIRSILVTRAARLQRPAPMEIGTTLAKDEGKSSKGQGKGNKDEQMAKFARVIQLRKRLAAEAMTRREDLREESDSPSDTDIEQELEHINRELERIHVWNPPAVTTGAAEPEKENVPSSASAAAADRAEGVLVPALATAMAFWDDVARLPAGAEVEAALVKLGVELPVDMKYVTEQDLTDHSVAVVTARNLLT